MPGNPRSTLAIAGHPLHPMLVPLPLGLLVGAFVSDLACWRSGWGGFADFSTWLIGGGLATALLAAVAGLTDLVSEPRIRALSKAWWHMAAMVLAVMLSIANFAIRLHDGAAALPAGLALSAMVAVLLAFGGWMGGEMVFRHRVGVREPGAREP